MTVLALTGWTLAALLAWACNRVWDRCDQRGQRIRSQHDAATCQAIEHEEELSAAADEVFRLDEENCQLRSQIADSQRRAS